MFSPEVFNSSFKLKLHVISPLSKLQQLSAGFGCSPPVPLCHGSHSNTPSRCTQETFVSPGSGGWTSEARPLADPVSGDSLFLVGARHLPAMSSHQGQQRQNMPSSMDTSPIRQGPPS